jgi:hypothetical protein
MKSRLLSGALGLWLTVLIVLSMIRKWWLGPRLGSVNLAPLALTMLLPAAFWLFKRAGWGKDGDPAVTNIRFPSILSQQEIPASQRGMPVWQLSVLLSVLFIIGLLATMVWAQFSGK